MSSSPVLCSASSLNSWLSMQDDYGSCCLTWFISDDDDNDGEPLSCADDEDGSYNYDDSYYLVYEENEIPYGYGGCGSWLGDYLQTFQRNEDDLPKEENQGMCHFSFYDDDDHMHPNPNYSEENNWLQFDDPDDIVEWDKCWTFTFAEFKRETLELWRTSSRKVLAVGLAEILSKILLQKLESSVPRLSVLRILGSFTDVPSAGTSLDRSSFRMLALFQLVFRTDMSSAGILRTAGIFLQLELPELACPSARTGIFFSCWNWALLNWCLELVASADIFLQLELGTSELVPSSVHDCRLMAFGTSLDDFLNGLESFIEFAVSRPAFIDEDKIKYQGETTEIVTTNLNIGRETISNTYHQMVFDVGGPNLHMDDSVANQIPEEPPNPEVQKLYDMLDAADKELWPGCQTHSQFSLVARLMTLKSENNMSQKCFDQIIELMKEIVSANNLVTIPQRNYCAVWDYQ
ncbi:hypothetical protein C2S51_034043 [Perilla frutescens var. frutescens]|nr:hypothetical protein C2S51_034043 [Perilla frutescens var. frutescens]